MGVNMKILKVIFVQILAFLFWTSSVNAQEVKSLYMIQNIPRENLANIINNYLIQSNFKVLSKNDFYFVPSGVPENSNNYYEVLLNQDGENCYMLYLSASGDTNLSDLIEKEVRKGHLKVKKLDNNQFLGMFDSKERALTCKIDNQLASFQSYDFSEHAQNAYDEMDSNIVPVASVAVPQSPVIPQYSIEKSQKTVIKSKTQVPKNEFKPSEIMQAADQKVLKGAVVTVASGTSFDVSLQSAVSSASLSQNDVITAILDEDFKYNGYVIFPTGTILYGTAANASAASYGYGNGSLELNFSRALLPSGQKINISVNKISYAKKSERAAHITRDVAVGAGVGALGGLLTAIYTGNVAQALIVGASIGAAGGGLHSVSSRGEEIEIPEGSKINIQLIQPINISPYK